MSCSSFRTLLEKPIVQLTVMLVFSIPLFILRLLKYCYYLPLFEFSFQINFENSNSLFFRLQGG